MNNLTLSQARTQAILAEIASRKKGIILDWFRITEIRKKVGCTKHQLDQSIEELRDNGEIVVGIYRGQVVIMADTAKNRTPAPGGMRGLTKDQSNVA